jgi:hypothetical protein
MPPAGAQGGWRAWARLIRDVPYLVDRARRGVWLRQGAYRVGRLAGSLQYRTRYL